MKSVLQLEGRDGWVYTLITINDENDVVISDKFAKAIKKYIEDYDPEKADIVKDCSQCMKRIGLSDLPKQEKEGGVKVEGRVTSPHPWPPPPEVPNPKAEDGKGTDAKNGVISDETFIKNLRRMADSLKSK